MTGNDRSGAGVSQVPRGCVVCESSEKNWEYLIQHWVQSLSAAGRSRETIRVRAATVRQVARESQSCCPACLDSGWLLGWCAAHDWSRDHRRTVRASLNGFYAFVGGVNPAAALPVVAMSAPAPRPVPEAAWQELIASADQLTLMMARLAGEAGLRRAEVAQVRREDVEEHVGGFRLLVRGKGGRTRFVPLTRGLAHLILACPPGWLFPSRGGHMSADRVGRRVSALLPPGFTMHKLRHRFASRGYAGTGDLIAVQHALGHSSVATTQRYVACDDAAVRRVAEAAETKKRPPVRGVIRQVRVRRLRASPALHTAARR